MLSIYWGVTEECHYYIDAEFEEVYEMSWFEDPLAQEIIADIDHCSFNGFGCIDLDDPEIRFSVTELSTGSKGLLMLMYLAGTEDSVFRIWGTAFGDNCSPWLLRLAEDRDFVLELEHLLEFPEENFRGYSLHQNREFKDYQDYLIEEIRWGYRAWCQ